MASLETWTLPGKQYRIEHGGLQATVTEVGATLRELLVNGSPVLWGFPEESICSGSQGQVLAPWPNRLGDGFYIFRGVTGHVPIDEPERHNAIHGLVRWLNWSVVIEERSFVELECPLPPQPAYPFPLLLSVAYRLDERGLTVRTRAQTSAPSIAPFGVGFHPYFLAGTQGLSGACLEFAAARHLLVDERGLPMGAEPLDGPFAAFAAGGADLSAMVLDDCFSGLRRQGDGDALVRFYPGGGAVTSVTLHLDRSFDYLMCFTGDTLQTADRRRAVALEPMTCPPNALASGASLIELGVGDPFEANFTIELA